MAKRKKNAGAKPEAAKRKAAKQPKFTHAAFQITFWTVILGMVAQLVMAVIVYPSLPRFIPSGWVGSSVPYNLVPSWLVFIVFPGAQLIVFLVAIFSPKDSNGRRIMEHGKAVTLVLLAILFTLLQFSAFYVPRG